MADRRTLAIVLVGIAALLLAPTAEWMAWRGRLIVGVPHLSLGWVVIGGGLIAYARVPRSRIGPIVVAAGTAWFVSALADGATDSGRLAASLAFLYTGVLAHALFTYPAGRLDGRLDQAFVASAYAVAILGPVWRSDRGLVVIGLLLMAALIAQRRHRAPAVRRDSAPATSLGLLVAALLVTTPVAKTIGSTVLREMVPAPVDTVALLADMSFLLVGVGLTWSLLRLDRRRAAVSDLVVELGAGKTSGLASEFRVALGDPGIEVGFWREATGRYEDEAGRPIQAPEPGDPRSVLQVEDHGLPLAIVVHHPSLIQEADLRSALAQSAEMAAHNAALRRELVAQADALAASRRRLLEAGDDERRSLRERLRRGPASRLEHAAEVLAGLERGPRAAGAPADPHVGRASIQLARARAELDEIGRGLDPGSIAQQGIVGALRDLADRSPVPVELVMPPSDVVTSPVGTTLYYVASEAFANVTRHAAASRVWLRLDIDGHSVVLEVADDGVGGADPELGSGLRGLQDRLDALGGTLVVGIRPGGGTRLVARLPDSGRVTAIGPAQGPPASVRSIEAVA